MTAYLLVVLVPMTLAGGIAWLVSRSRVHALGAAAAVLLYFVLYLAWVHSQPPDGLIWLGYVVSLPGAALGALVGAVIARGYRSRGRRVLVGIGVLVTAAGIAINQAALCMTLMHCAT